MRKEQEFHQIKLVCTNWLQWRHHGRGQAPSKTVIWPPPKKNFPFFLLSITVCVKPVYGSRGMFYRKSLKKYDVLQENFEKYDWKLYAFRDIIDQLYSIPNCDKQNQFRTVHHFGHTLWDHWRRGGAFAFMAPPPAGCGPVFVLL